MSFSLSSLPSKGHVHFIGIGGVSMSGLAEILIDRGFKVSGSDRQESPLTKRLRALGADIYIGQCAENIHNPDAVVYSAAIKPDNPEFVAAKESGALVFDRATLVGAIMKLYPYPIAIAGTHGKTTSTSMMSHIALAANLDPTISIGGELPAIGGNIRVGKGQHFICEACEYHQSFLRFFPLVSIILNIEEDHLDYFRDLTHIQETFLSLADLTPPEGAVIVNLDDYNTQTALYDADGQVRTNARIITCGHKNADYTLEEMHLNENGCWSFVVSEFGNRLGEFTLSVPGTHNVSNALCVIAAARFLDIPFESIQKGLFEFTGVGRRFEKKGEKNGVTVIDDYAHHPTEIAATLKVAKETCCGRVWCVFQPHTYTRTKTLFNEFVSTFNNISPLILDIYAAREKDTGLVSSHDLVRSIPGSMYFPSFEDCADYIQENAKKGDILLTMGAGDVYRVGDIFLEK